MFEFINNKNQISEIFIDVSQSRYEFFTLNYYIKSGNHKIKVDTNSYVLNNVSDFNGDLLFINNKSYVSDNIPNNYKFEKKIDSYKIFKKIK